VLSGVMFSSRCASIVFGFRFGTTMTGMSGGSCCRRFGRERFSDFALRYAMLPTITAQMFNPLIC
jgi:hypothetical protein